MVQNGKEKTVGRDVTVEEVMEEVGAELNAKK